MSDGVKIVQLTDTHIHSGAGGIIDGAATAAKMRRAVEHINHMADEIGALDAVIHTGDLAEEGHPDEYARFREIAEDLTPPLFAVPGNHDDRAAMRDAGLAPEGAGEDGPIFTTLDLGPIDAILLDTTVPGASHGALDADQAHWALDTVDADSGDGRPALIFAHHPPFETGVGYMDAIKLRSGAAHLDVLMARPNVLLFACGHHHRMITTTIAGTTAIAAPACSGQLTLDFRAGAAPSVAPEQSAVLLHVWRETGGPFGSVSTYFSAF